ncbi:unnamed protein product [Mytilus coruscus]|uniref:Uncharacterized protein n=1 Tax=Mytilus coruscus TaxID=42192 RepID=A0A6J8CJQ7_MYTCO|nr:unnamed protein product [Mytilus coruscus]
MSKRGAEPTTSSAHIAFKQWFGNSHFENHKTKYFRHGNWRCKTSDRQDCEVEEDVVLSTNSTKVIALAGLASAFPATTYKLYKYVGFQKDNFTKFVVCKKCYKLYKYEDCIIIVEGQQQSKQCNNVIFPNHTHVGRRRPCGEPLLKVVQLQATKKLYPFKTYCYKSIALTLSSCVQRPDFEEKCEIWRSRRQEPGFLADVFDGNIWREFQSAEKNNFLKNKQNYEIMFNLDWFQPYEHVQYSVGVMYAVILNLPREERFKIKNVILLGIIPDMKKEPSVQTFIGPLIDELKVGWKEGFLLTSYQEKNKETIFKIALMCVGCDIPATRKLLGDVGHKCYGGFDVNEWPSRNLLEQRHNMNVVKSAITQSERDRLESQFGISFERYNGHLSSLPNNSRAIELQIMRRFTRDAYVNSIVLPENFQELFRKNFLELNRCTEIGLEVTDQEIRNLLYLSRRSAPIPNQDWSYISAYKFSKVSTHCLTAEEYRVLKHTYKTIYPDLAHMVLPESCRKCSFVTLRNEVYGSWESRHKRPSFVMAYWNAGDGKIVEDVGTGDLLPGIVQTYYLHNLIVENEGKVHLFAKVNWLAPLPDRYRYHCEKPVEVWSRDIYDVFGTSAFIPVQKIYCKYVRADGKLSEKLVSYICPLNSGMNI